jgi:glycosyltransferase involved in cell wall biosynthesis
MQNNMSQPFFSIITPSYNMLPYVKACHNSVIDQGVSVEHIVVDGASTDGTREWLSSKPEIVSISEKDEGMYDAINKGILVSSGQVIAYLNCDEQYLAGVLAEVQDFFEKNTSIDILFGNTLIIRPDGELLAFRKAFTPRWPYIWGSYMYLHSSSMFFRKKIIQTGFVFDTRWKTIGDADFAVRVLRHGNRAVHIEKYLSAFIMTGSNLGGSAIAESELREYRRSAPFWLRYSTWPTNALIRIEKLIRGLYFERMPLRYSVFPVGQPNHRVPFTVTKSSPLFPKIV